MKIQVEQNPFRLGVWIPQKSIQCILQYMPDPLEGEDRIVIGEVKWSNKPRAELKILFNESIQEFMDGWCPIIYSEDSVFHDVERAFQNYLKQRYNLNFQLSF